MPSFFLCFENLTTWKKKGLTGNLGAGIWKWHGIMMGLGTKLVGKHHGTSILHIACVEVLQPFQLAGEFNCHGTIPKARQSVEAHRAGTPNRWVASNIFHVYPFLRCWNPWCFRSHPVVQKKQGSPWLLTRCTTSQIPSKSRCILLLSLVWEKHM